jgi:hypothetical protein
LTLEIGTLEDYLPELRSRVIVASQELGDSDLNGTDTGFREQGFTSVITDLLADLGHIADVKLCYFEHQVSRNIAKVNAFSLDEDEQHLHLVTSLFNGLESPGRVNRSEIQRAVDRAGRVVTAASSNYSSDLEPASDEFDMIDRIEDSKDSIEKVTIHVLVDGFVGDVSGVSVNADGVAADFSVWDLRRINRAESSGLSYEPTDIDLVERFGRPLACLEPDESDVDYRTFLTVIPGEMLYTLYNEFGPRLLELNVRSFLQARGKVNQGIRDTLKDNPDRFLAYNNGLSATAEWVDIISDDGGTKAISKLRGLQVVNGGQTVASIHRAGIMKQDLSDVYVQAKLTVISTDQIDTLVPLISRYANTQNKVNEADFSANHPYHVKIQQLSRDTWVPGEQSRWFYERARGQYETDKSREGNTPARRRQFTQANPVPQRFDKVKLSKYVNAWWEVPHTVSLGGQKCFVGFMKRQAQAYPAGWEPDASYFRDLVAKAIIFKQAERMARQFKFPAYRANVIAYTVSLIAHRTAGRVNLQSIWNDQAISLDLEAVMHDWMPEIFDEIVESAAGRNVTEWCKKEECWRHIQTMDLTISPGLEAELDAGQPLPTVGTKRAGASKQLSSEDRENLAKVMQISSDEWLHFVKWGSSTGELTEFQTDISATLASYAARNWTRVPSVRQAVQAVKVIDIASLNSGRLIDDDDM